MKVRPEHERIANSLATQLWQERRYEAGQCVQCGQRHDRPGRTPGTRARRCARCAGMERAYVQARQAQDARRSA